MIEWLGVIGVCLQLSILVGPFYDDSFSSYRVDDG